MSGDPGKRADILVSLAEVFGNTAFSRFVRLGERARMKGCLRIVFNHQLSGLNPRVGDVIDVDDFPEARHPAWKLRIDFGPEIGLKRSSAQITNYSREQLLNRMVLAVANFRRAE